jgi:hypothetical protein
VGGLFVEMGGFFVAEDVIVKMAVPLSPLSGVCPVSRKEAAYWGKTLEGLSMSTWLGKDGHPTILSVMEEGVSSRYGGK